MTPNTTTKHHPKSKMEKPTIFIPPVVCSVQDNSASNGRAFHKVGATTEMAMLVMDTAVAFPEGMDRAKFCRCVNAP